MSQRFTKSKNGKTRSQKPGMTKTGSNRYPTYDHEKSRVSVKMTPSVMLQTMSQTNDSQQGRPMAPKIIEFLNIEDYSTQVKTTVDINEPLFQVGLPISPPL